MSSPTWSKKCAIVITMAIIVIASILWAGISTGTFSSLTHLGSIGYGVAILSRSLAIAGAVILVASIFPITKILAGLPPKSRMYKKWCALTVMIIFFVVGYAFFIASIWHGATDLLHLVISMVFFFGGCFVWIVNTLSLGTMTDILKVSQLEMESITDGLTGLYNRRYLDRRLEEEFHRARRHKIALSVLIMDIDHFKAVNDRFGHQIGDLVLKELAQLILGTVRDHDIVARYGGEELVVIAVNTDLDAACLFAERIRKEVQEKELAFDVNNAASISVTLSIGVCALSPLFATPEQMLDCADKMLYQAKRSGRNRVCFDNPNDEVKICCNQ